MLLDDALPHWHRRERHRFFLDRVRATDMRSRRLFGLYWLIIRGGSGLVRHIWLRAIRRRARLIGPAPPRRGG